MEDIKGNYGYSTGGYTISGLQRLANKEHSLDIRHTGRKKDRDKGELLKPEVREEILRKHKEGKTWTQIAREMSFHRSYIYTLMHDYIHAKPMKKEIILSEEQIQWLKDNYPTTANKEVARHLGCGTTKVYMISRELGLEKDKAYLRNLKLELHKSVNMEAQQATRAKRVSQERRRILYGLPQQTKLKLSDQPHGKSSCRYRLKKRGYKVDFNSNVAYYTDETKRYRRTEETAQKWGIDVRQWNKEKQ